MTKICLFAGTTEGRRIAEFLSENKADLTVCVATGYGGEMLTDTEGIRLIEKRLSAADILDLLKTERFDLVIDATHPYAALVTENIFRACTETNTAFLRVLRESSDLSGAVITVPDVSAAAEFLNKTEGNILLTTGSREISGFTALRDFAGRVYARVLPMQASLESCIAAGLKSSHIIAMQGPFSEEMNIAMIHTVNARWLVTKDSGETGGFDAKAAVAEKTGTKMVVIGRPPQKEGISGSECIGMLCRRFGFEARQQVTIAGIGPGSREQMTSAVRAAIGSAECLIGAGRMLRSADSTGKILLEETDPEKISGFIQSHRDLRRFAVLMSGDSGFFSGTRRLLPFLSGQQVEILPGISSLSYFCAKLGISYEDVKSVSLHGRDHLIIPDVRANKLTFVLTGGEHTVNDICRTLDDNGMAGLRIAVGEQLGYDDEKISRGTAGDMKDGSYAPLSVMLIRNEHPDAVVTHGLPDGAFMRDSGAKGLIPMTKQEIRSVCLSKLALTEHAVCWDIGSGTGSVSIEMALQAGKGTVYAVEQDPEAAALSQRNAKALFAENIVFICGTAPEACRDLPTPTHVFIGGSTGKLTEIIGMIAGRGSEVTVTVTAVTLESVSELNSIRKLPCVRSCDVVMVQTASDKKAGEYHLMSGGNPVYIFTMLIAGGPG